MSIPLPPLPIIWHNVVGLSDLDAMVLAKPTLGELAGILSEPSKSALAALFLALAFIFDQKDYMGLF